MLLAVGIFSYFHWLIFQASLIRAAKTVLPQELSHWVSLSPTPPSPAPSRNKSLSAAKQWRTGLLYSSSRGSSFGSESWSGNPDADLCRISAAPNSRRWSPESNPARGEWFWRNWLDVCDLSTDRTHECRRCRRDERRCVADDRRRRCRRCQRGRCRDRQLRLLPEKCREIEAFDWATSR